MSCPLLPTWLLCKALFCVYGLRQTDRHVRLPLFQGSVSSKLDVNFSDSCTQHTAEHVVHSYDNVFRREKKQECFTPLSDAFMTLSVENYLILLLGWHCLFLLELKFGF